MKTIKVRQTGDSKGINIIFPPTPLFSKKNMMAAFVLVRFVFDGFVTKQYNLIRCYPKKIKIRI